MSAKGTLNTAIYRLEQFHRLNSARVTIPIVTRKQSSDRDIESNSSNLSLLIIHIYIYICIYKFMNTYI
jgi:hypothetical protein